MTIRIVAHEERLRNLVDHFNVRMREGGSPWGFYVDPVPRWIPKRPGQKTWREYYVAIENDREVVGGYALKPQEWLVRGERKTIADWQGPFSLGAIDRRYSTLGLRMVRDMLQRHPMLYSWGQGGDEEPLVQMLRKMGWLMHPTPFLLRVTKPFNFLRKNAYLRREKTKALLQDFLAFSGLGSVGLHGLHAGLAAGSFIRFASKARVVDSFGPWADEVWKRCHGHYDAIAIRDAATMNALLPPQHDSEEWPAPTRLLIEAKGRILGWAVVIERQLQGDTRFGDMRVGMIVDYLGAPADARDIVHAAFAHLRARDVDMVMANQSHPVWIAGFVQNGFVAVPGGRGFCAAPQLERALAPFDRLRRGLFLSNMDGHGPML